MHVNMIEAYSPDLSTKRLRTTKSDVEVKIPLQILITILNCGCTQ